MDFEHEHNEIWLPGGGYLSDALARAITIKLMAAQSSQRI